MRRPAGALSATVALVGVTATAAAHPAVTPTFVTSGERETVTVVAPNERQERMSGFSVTLPRQLSLVAAGASDVGWPGTVRGATARWTGCCVAPGAVASFSMDVEGADEAGDVQLEVRQLYPDGEHVRWTVPLTLLPGKEESGAGLGTVLLVSLVGLVVTVGLVVLVWRRRAPPLQER